MSYSTIGGKVTKGETFAKLLYHLGEAQSAAATIAHLHSLQDNAADGLAAQGWLGVAELFKRLTHQVTELAKRGLH